MNKKILFQLMFFITAVFAFASCSSDDDDYKGYLAGNPMPGTWYANNVDWKGYPVNMTVCFQDSFKSGENLYLLYGDSIGCMNAYYADMLFDSAKIKKCLYNSKTYTGEVTVQYADDDKDYTLKYYYDAKYDRFTVIDVNFNVTFLRK